jgi:integrase
VHTSSCLIFAVRINPLNLGAYDAQNTFEAVTREWHNHKKGKWASERYADDVITRIADNLFSDIGHRPISSIAPPELLACLRKIEKRGAYEIAKRCRQVAGQVFRYGIAIGVCERDISADLKDALASRKKVHFRALDIQTLPPFLDALDKNSPRLYAQTIHATRLLVLTFVQTSELINAHWDEIRFDKAEWHIPAERMKMRRPHIVPLSKQALDILEAQKLISGHRPFIFPSIVHGKKSMSNGTILGAIRRLGFKQLTTEHGFRALARTTIREELDYPADVIETQLAHKSQGALGEAYDRTQFLKKRKVMMQDWANYIDSLSSQGKVIRGKFGG